MLYLLHWNSCIELRKGHLIAYKFNNFFVISSRYMLHSLAWPGDLEICFFYIIILIAPGLLAMCHLPSKMPFIKLLLKRLNKQIQFKSPFSCQNTWKSSHSPIYQLPLIARWSSSSSGFRPDYSTERALTEVVNDLLVVFNFGSGFILNPSWSLDCRMSCLYPY